MKVSGWLVAAVLILSTGTVFGQFKPGVKEEPRVSDGLIQESSTPSFFGWFDPARFHMQHSLSFSYQSFGGQGLSLGTYTNSMMYEFANNLNAGADVSMSYSPFNSFPRQGKQDLSNIYLSRAQLNYKPWENFLIHLQYRNIPYGYASPWYNPWYRQDGF